MGRGASRSHFVTFTLIVFRQYPYWRKTTTGRAEIGRLPVVKTCCQQQNLSAIRIGTDIKFEPRSFTFEDGFANEDFTPDTSLPVGINTYSFSSHDDGTRAVYEAIYPSVEALQQVLDMGMVEGSTAAIGQLDAFLA